jgi:uncharacterized protein (DUF1501 family)
MRRFEEMFLTRRDLIRLGGVTMTGYHLLPLVQPKVQAAGKANPRGSARFCIFVMLTGGQSHVDAWDLKEGPWTPQDFDIKTIGPGIKWPMSLYPNMAARLDKFALVRSLEGWESQHGRGQYYVQVAHQHNPALAPELPPIGAVVASEYASRRRPSDSMPPYVAFNTFDNQVGLIGPGFLPATYGPFHINTKSDLSAFAPPEQEKKEFQRRWEMLKQFDGRLRTDPSLEKKAFRDYHNYYEGAVSLMSDPRSGKIFHLPEADRARYGATNTGDAFILARNLVSADAGTHFIFLSHEGWDHHRDIYDPGNHYRLSRELDLCLANLLDDLEAEKRTDGKSLLDETLVIAMGEFGRTPGPLTNIAGRDHHQYAFSGFFAGGGVKGGQIIGTTDELGAKVVEPQWGPKRNIYMEDVATTIYSAMGIDWTKKIEQTPSGRAFYYIEIFSPTQLLANQEITPLFG